MNEFQFMVFLQKANLAINTQRDVPIHERAQGVDKLSAYLCERLEADENPIYLHEVGDNIIAKLNAGRS